jgi:hypothetical protein
MFPIQNDINQGDALLPLLFNFASEYTIKNVQENQVRLKLNGAHLLLACTTDVNLLADKINTIKEKLTDAKEEDSLEVNTEKPLYILLSHHQNAGQSRKMKTVNRSFEDVAEFKYLGKTATNQNFITEEIKSNLNPGNACYFSFRTACLFVCHLRT